MRESLEKFVSRDAKRFQRKDMRPFAFKVAGVVWRIGDDERMNLIDGVLLYSSDLGTCEISIKNGKVKFIPR